jgi:tetratricopeptide (TPR) repeat protein
MYKHPLVYSLARRIDRFLYLPLLFSAFVFALTFISHTYPGHSAQLVAEAARLTPSLQHTHSLFFTFTQAIASCDIFSLPIRLNLFSLICGCLSATLFYRLLARTILIYGYDPHEDEDTAEWPEEAKVAAPDFATLVNTLGTYNQRLFPIAIKSSLAATLLLSLMAPFWLASTHLNESIFNLTLLLLILTLMPAQATPRDHLRYLCAIVLFSLGVFESVIFIILLPVMVQMSFSFFLRTENRGLILLHTVFGGLAAILISFVLRPVPSDALYVQLLPSLEQFLRAVAQHHLAELKLLFGAKGWLASFLQVALPASILFFGKKIFFEKWNSSTCFTALFILAGAIPSILSLSLSPFSVFQEADYLPVLSASILAATLGLVLAKSLLFFVPKIATATFNKEVILEGDDAPKPPSNKPALFFVTVLLIFALMTPLRSLPYVTASTSRFADALAQNILDSLGERSWLVTHGQIDSHLLIHAHDAKKSLHLITLRKRENPKERLALQRLIERAPAFKELNHPRLLNALSIGTLRFVSEWFMSDTNSSKKVGVFATPDLWTASRLRAIPNGVVFLGCPEGKPLEPHPLIIASETLATAVAPLLLGKGEKAPPGLARLSSYLRLKMGFSVNELGTILEGDKHPKEAFALYQRASKIDPDNVSALLNAYALAKGGMVKSNQADDLRQQLRQLLLSRTQTQLGLRGLFLNYGTLHQKDFYQQEAAAWLARGAQAIAAGKIAKSLDLSQQAGVNALLERAYYYSLSGKLEEAEACYLAALEQDATDFDALYRMTLLQINRRDIPQAEKWLARATAAQKDNRQTLLYPTILICLQKGEQEKADKLLVEATTKYPREEHFWKLRATCLLQQGDLLIVRHRLIPEMEKALQDSDHYLVHLVRGLLLKAQGPSSYREARISLLKSLSRNASMMEVWNTVLDLDMHIGHLGLLESDLHHLLNLDPNHAQANYMKGSIQLALKNMDSAEDFMRRSIERTPTAIACNDLAEILRRKKKYDEAKAFAHQAISLDPQLPNARATLAAILADSQQEESR